MQTENTPIGKVNSASVRVMRSFDYSHFEIMLSSNPDQGGLDLKAVDELRKEAQRLADKAVAQYQIAKRNAQRLLVEGSDRAHLVNRMERIRLIAETDRTVGQQAELKAFDDASWAASREYDYEDDWDQDQND